MMTPDELFVGWNQQAADVLDQSLAKAKARRFFKEDRDLFLTGTTNLYQKGSNQYIAYAMESILIMKEERGE